MVGLTAGGGRSLECGDSKMLGTVVDLLVTAVGSYKVMLKRHQISTHAFLIDPAMWRSSVLRPFSRTLLSSAGDSEKHFVVGEYSLKHMNFSADGMITGLS